MGFAVATKNERRFWEILPLSSWPLDDWKKMHLLSERHRIMGARLREPLKPLGTILPRDVPRGFRGPKLRLPDAERRQPLRRLIALQNFLPEMHFRFTSISTQNDRAGNFDVYFIYFFFYLMFTSFFKQRSSFRSVLN